MIYYGQKLQLDDLFDTEWKMQFAEPSRLAFALKMAGVTFIEIPIGEETNSKKIVEMSRIFTGEGLFVSLHPYLYKELSPEIFDETRIPGLSAMLETAQQVSEITGFPVPYVFHGGRARSEPYFVEPVNAVHNAKKFFSWIDDACEKIFTSVVPLCETQTPWDLTDKELIRLGDTYQTCLDLVQDTDIGICWDFGHTHRSSLIGKQPVLPDEYFLARVQHVHAHDTIETGGGQEDHFPLGDGLAPWRRYCTELARHLYSDTILLEITPSRFRDLDELVFFARDGIERLRVFFEDDLIDTDDFEEM